MRAIRGSVLCVGVLLALGANAACAAALGSFATSLGIFAALAALAVSKGWPAHVPASALTTGGAFLIAGGAAWLWRARPASRLLGFAGAPMSPISGAPRSLASPTPTITLPQGLDLEPLLVGLRRQFIELQEAWDRADTHALAHLVTLEMLEELQLELGACAAGQPRERTEIVSLEAHLLGFERLPQADVMSVEFSGLMREGASEGAVAFRELWLLTRSKDSAQAWRLARHQALF